MQSKAVLLRALRTARKRVRERGAHGVLFRVDFDAAVRAFKASWLYTSSRTLNYAPNKAAGSHMFLFHKNLHVTNLSHAELLALLRVHTRRREDGTEHEINFFTDGQYSTFLRNLIESLVPPTPIRTIKDYDRITDEVAGIIADQHASLVLNTIIVNSYFTTSLIHIPVSLSADLQRLVYESGYIQSAGHAVYVRRVDKADQSELENRLKLFLNSKHVMPPVYLTPYADEYFTDHEKKTSIASTRNGLDGVRLELRKHHINAQPLRDFLTALEERVEGLYVAKGIEHYGTEREKSETDKNWTIWIITDTGNIATSEGAITRAQDSYLIVYAQYFENGNQFVIFKERKPAWTAPITIPHTLSTAAINIVRPTALRHAKRPVILDPFCGTGTTLIDAAIRIPNAVIIGLDRNPLSARMVKDNLQFFSFDAPVINDLRSKYSDLRGSLMARIEGDPNSHVPRPDVLFAKSVGFDIEDLAAGNPSLELQFKNAVCACLSELGFADKIAKEGADASQHIIDQGFSSALTALLSSDSMSWESRLMFFLTWRALANARHVVGYQGNLYKILHKEFDRFVKELEHYHSGIAADRITKLGMFAERHGKYSRSGLVDVEKIRGIVHRDLSSGQLAKCAELPTRCIHTFLTPDSTESLAELRGQVDILITDPPFGFNTSEYNFGELQRLYSQFITRAISSLKPAGQLVVSVPSFARNGKQVPYFQTQGPVIRQIVAAANEANRDIVQVIHTLPAPKAVYSPPFFWISPSALSRRVLWFTMGNGQ